MFTMILEDARGREIARLALAGNERYLMREGDLRFPLLSSLDTLSWDAFSQQQGLELQRELLSVLSELQDPAERRHVQELAQLALRAANTEGAKIFLTPFQKPPSW